MFTLEKLYRKSLRCKYRFVIYHLEERSVPTAIRYKKSAQIFVSSVNRNPIRYTIRDVQNSYNLMNENTSYLKKLIKQKSFKFCWIHSQIYLIHQIWSHLFDRALMAVVNCLMVYLTLNSWLVQLTALLSFSQRFISDFVGYKIFC